MRHFLLALAAAGTPLFAQIPDNLVADGVPPITPELRADASRYLEFRAAAMQSWHPQRREMLISTRFADTAQLHLVKMPGGARRQLTFGAEPILGGSFRPTTGEFLVFAQDSGGGEFYQLYRYDLADGRSTLLTDGKSRNGGARWARSGRQFAYTSTRRTGKDTDIYTMNPAEPKSDKLALERAGGGWSVSDWSEDETKLLLTEYVSANESHAHLLDLASGNVTLLTPEKSVHSGAKFSRDGKCVFLLSDAGSEFAQLVRLDLAGGARTILTAGLAWDVESFDLSPDGKTIAFATNEDGASALHLMHAETGKAGLPLKTPVGVIGGIDWHENGRDLGLRSMRHGRRAMRIRST